MIDPTTATGPQARCRRCRHWSPLAGNPEQGECRRFAPRPAVSSSVHMLASWPVTNGDDWCGEFVARPKDPG